MEKIKGKIMVVDDDFHVLNSVTEILRRKGHDPFPCSNGIEALKALANNKFNLVISDVRMSPMSGIELLERTKEIDPNVPFIIMTAYGNIEGAVDSMKKGAYDFIEKGSELLNKLEFAIARALQHQSLLDENKSLKNILKHQWQFIGEAESIESVRNLISTIAQSRSTVLVSGASGTGKELIAKSIHYTSNRRNKSFVKINCAALPEGLIESELFGHERGAFTGAVRKRAGKFEAASGGTLLLDEIGDMPMSAQAKLLRVLQEGEINRIGSDTTVPIDVRVVATTNRNLCEEIRKNKFREDLYYRVNVFHIELPSLSERMNDIPLLVEHFIEKYNNENGFSVSGIEESALKKLKTYSWPGNIRELENCVERAVVLLKSGKINSEVFNFRNTIENNGNAFTPGMTVAEAEKKLIFTTLNFCNQNRTKTADMLEISIRTLRNKLKEYSSSIE